MLTIEERKRWVIARLDDFITVASFTCIPTFGPPFELMGSFTCQTYIRFKAFFGAAAFPQVFTFLDVLEKNSTVLSRKSTSSRTSR